MTCIKKKKPGIRSLANHFGIGKMQAVNVIKHSEKLTNKWYSNLTLMKNTAFLRRRVKQWACYIWFIRARNKGIPVAEGSRYENFNASDGWLQKFRIRQNITFKTISGEAASVNLDKEQFFLK